jgi:hypothetical protein
LPTQEGTPFVRKTAINAGPRTPTGGARKSPVVSGAPPPESAPPCLPGFCEKPVFLLVFSSQVHGTWQAILVQNQQLQNTGQLCGTARQNHVFFAVFPPKVHGTWWAPARGGLP